MREKLIELFEDDDCPLFMVFGDNMGGLADHLIANGVTIQQWIPVTERLPEPFISVLVCMPSEEPFPVVREGYYVAEDKCWVVTMYATIHAPVTHWMPLPEPPKEDTK